MGKLSDLNRADHDEAIAIVSPLIERAPQIAAKVAEMGANTALHWDELLTTLLEANTACYDGSNYFATHRSRFFSWMRPRRIYFDRLRKFRFRNELIH